MNCFLWLLKRVLVNPIALDGLSVTGSHYTAVNQCPALTLKRLQWSSNKSEAVAGVMGLYQL